MTSTETASRFGRLSHEEALQMARRIVATHDCPRCGAVAGDECVPGFHRERAQGGAA